MYNEILHYMRNVKAPEPLKRLTALMATSAFLEGRSWMMQGPVQRLYPNLFILVIANPGNGKSLMSNVIMEIIRRYNKTYGEVQDTQVTVGSKVSNPSAFIQRLVSERSRKEISGPYGPETSTPIFLPAAELAVMCENTRFGNMLTDLLELYEVLPIFDKETRANGYESVERCCPVMVGNTTPSFWFGALPDNLARDGFAARCLLYFFNEFIERDANIGWGSLADLDAVVDAGAKLKTMSGLFQLTSEAKEYVEGPLNKANNELMFKHFGGSDLIQGYTNRRMDQIKKLSMCFAAALGGTHSVSVDHINFAIKHLTYIEDSLNGLVTKKDTGFKDSLGATIDRIFDDGKSRSFEDVSAALYAKNMTVRNVEIQEILDSLISARALVKDAGRYARKPRGGTDANKF
jgi:hypothetical protein